MVAVAQDQEAARCLGVRPRPVKLAAFGFGGLLAGLAGGLYACFAGFVSSVSFGVVASFQLAVMVVLGGLGSVGGAITGAAVVLAADQRLQARPAVRLAATGAAMIVVVFARNGVVPDGVAWLQAARRRRRRGRPQEARRPG
jgi:branched-chain amino acid transport system permease protein